jgi:hypothetical protein
MENVNREIHEIHANKTADSLRWWAEFALRLCLPAQQALWGVAVLWLANDPVAPALRWATEVLADGHQQRSHFHLALNNSVFMSYYNCNEGEPGNSL